MRRRKLLAASVTLGVAALLTQIGGSGASARGSLPTVVSAPASSTGSSAVANLGATGGWKVLTSATATQGGAQISTPGFSTSGWLTVANDGGGAPGTEIGALLQNGSCPNVFFSANMKTCFGLMTKAGAGTIRPSAETWASPPALAA